MHLTTGLSTSLKHERKLNSKQATSGPQNSKFEKEISFLQKD